jgi:hypothetical protein
MLSPPAEPGSSSYSDHQIHVTLTDGGNFRANTILRIKTITCGPRHVCGTGYGNFPDKRNTPMTASPVENRHVIKGLEFFPRGSRCRRWCKNCRRMGALGGISRSK